MENEDSPKSKGLKECLKRQVAKRAEEQEKIEYNLLRTIFCSHQKIVFIPLIALILLIVIFVSFVVVFYPQVYSGYFPQEEGCKYGPLCNNQNYDDAWKEANKSMAFRSFFYSIFIPIVIIFFLLLSVFLFFFKYFLSLMCCSEPTDLAN